jgi:hypothetical protein
VRLPGPGPYRITYVAGRVPVPENYSAGGARADAASVARFAAESVRRPRAGADDQSMIVPGNASAMPYRVRELLGIYGAIVNDHPVIA